MGGRRRRTLQAAATITTVLALLLLLSSPHHSDARSRTEHKVLAEVNESQRREPRRLTDDFYKDFERVARRLIGPGSSPPSCRSKCGRCAPCRPVHVPIQPGLNKPLEYYPEAWRCKCGNTLFMP